MSWGQLAAILKEVKDPDFRSKTLQACPLCGEPLKLISKNTLFCNFDGWGR